MSEVLACRDLRKTFREGREAVRVLQGVSLKVEDGEIVAIVGVRIGSDTRKVVQIHRGPAAVIGDERRNKPFAT